MTSTPRCSCPQGHHRHYRGPTIADDTTSPGPYPPPPHHLTPFPADTAVTSAAAPHRHRPPRQPSSAPSPPSPNQFPPRTTRSHLSRRAIAIPGRTFPIEVGVQAQVLPQTYRAEYGRQLPVELVHSSSYFKVCSNGSDEPKQQDAASPTAAGRFRRPRHSARSRAGRRIKTVTEAARS